MTTGAVLERETLIRRGVHLAWFTIAWNAVECVAAIASGVAAGSIALIGFGVDSSVEVFAGGVIWWRLRRERRGEATGQAAEQRAVRLIAITFLLLAAGVGIESVRKLVVGAQPAESTFGIALAAVSLVVMPALARAKRRVGERLDSRAVVADAAETSLCVWLSAILLIGLGLNSLVGWWWADPLAGLAIVHVAGREGLTLWRAGRLDACC